MTLRGVALRQAHCGGPAARRREGGLRAWSLRGSAAGYSVPEMLIVVAIAGLAVVPALPGTATSRRRAVLAGAASHVAMVFRAARYEAVKRGAAVAVEFVEDGAEATYRLVVDGNGNGVRRAEIATGVDTPLGEARSIGDDFAAVRFVVGCRCADIDGGALLAHGTSGVRFGGSGLAVFAPAGTASSGTLYLSAGGETTYAVRVLGVSGRMRTLRYEPAAGEWTPP